MKTAKFKAGDTILSEGDEGASAFLIVDGSVEVTVGEGPHAKIVGTLGAGDTFGEMSLFEPGPRSATVRAVTDTECMVTSYDEFMASIHEHPERAVEFAKTLIHRLRQMNALMASMDPHKRTLRERFRDWQQTAADPEGNLSDDERSRRAEMAMMGYWGAF